MLSFGARFKSARLSAGHTQDSLADLLGVTKSAVSSWENDRGTPSFENLGAVRRALGVTLDDLVMGAAASEVAADKPLIWPVLPPRDNVRTPEERSMMKVFRGMSDRQRRGLLAAFGGLASEQQPLPRVAEPTAGYASQDLSPIDLSMAIQLANEKIAQAGLAPTPEEYGQLVLNLHDVLVDGLPDADVHDLRSGKLRHSSTGDDDERTASKAAREGQQGPQPAVEHGGKARRKS